MSQNPSVAGRIQRTDPQNLPNHLGESTGLPGRASTPGPVVAPTSAARPADITELRAPIRSSANLVFRKNQALMTWGEKVAFRKTFESLIEQGVLGERIQEYREHHQLHGTHRFLPWHRIFLSEFERDLQSINPKVTLPFWSWTTHQSVPEWLIDWKPEVSFLDSSEVVQVAREEGDSAKRLPSQAQIDAIRSRTTFEKFTSVEAGGLESRHVAVLQAVGGTMDSLFSAPADPLFWLHMAEVDRIWNEWQFSNVGLDPTLSGNAALMTPWKVSESETRSIRAMGYDYTI